MLARSLPITDYYDGLALDQALVSLDQAHRRIAVTVIGEGGASPFDTWLEPRRDVVDRVLERMAALTEEEALSVSRVTVVANHLADLAGL